MSKIKVRYGTIRREIVVSVPDDVGFHPLQRVIYERDYGLDWGDVSPSLASPDAEPTGTFIRIVTPEDLEAISHTHRVDKADIERFYKLVNECNLPMKLVGIDHSLDFRKITFFYLAEGRVDFRELVRLLAGAFRRKIELFQLNLRDQMKFFPVFGYCGRPICCKVDSALFDGKVPSDAFKAQRISPNMSKMTGCCGTKIRCCYEFEACHYRQFAEKLPRIGHAIEYGGHVFRLADWDAIKETVVLENPETESREAVPYADVAGKSAEDRI